MSDVQFFNYLLVGALYKYSHCLRSAFFWDITRSRVVIFTEFRDNISIPFYKSQEFEKMGPIRCPENVGKHLPRDSA